MQVWGSSCASPSRTLSNSSPQTSNVFIWCRYGAHGTSYRYLVGEAARMLGQSASSLNLIIAHVGPPCCSKLNPATTCHPGLSSSIHVVMCSGVFGRAQHGLEGLI